MSYNVLADRYMNQIVSGVRTTAVTNPKSFEQLDFEYRSNLILKEIEASQPDVFCLQEVDHYQRFYKHEIESLGYQTVISELRENIDYVTVLVAFKRKKFELVKTRQINM